ncbi:MAG TPA: hypothetical protein VF172_03225 [Nitrososphaera sp.]
MTTTNRIAEVAAELALYRVMIRIDEILEHYTGDAILEIEAAFWKLLHELQTSAIVARKSVKDHSRIE